MAIKASSFKNWCTVNISPQSWTRICLKRVDEIREKGHTLKEMEDLNPDIEMDDDLMESLNTALSELYEMTVNEDSLAPH
ncbi:hypothetical protein SAMN05421640_3308 [Ekhidna lutea]|uniref:Uncharacterized protein n=1 Tax=Ekhidna lutea TaxID=447679 RepID=A0A239LIE4_EKHLU|nr:hypothetical protein [Ekhidna lutea]SNT30447.1 hypothetical protein SAMN05421640_3308 [Ekhidna lutea]